MYPLAISVALSEIVRKKPDVTFFELFKSGREIGRYYGDDD